MTVPRLRETLTSDTKELERSLRLLKEELRDTTVAQDHVYSAFIRILFDPQDKEAREIMLRVMAGIVDRAQLVDMLLKKMANLSEGKNVDNEYPEGLGIMAIALGFGYAMGIDTAQRLIDAHELEKLNK